mmetsp:Transcript_24854/g.38310  ORF Transcript_24854/g.38310 Transcript_24854/m.38310 type:complete len:370 (-) Transcript_24854:287-1396(-)|eukprot:CAMPEP_0195288456 /NCGR_PEP_ID=MMETSP0707-20130614/5116_1 /TAXON_ID=33640 /ORGANISM="Asterionellopsis glacialis, Strain CCMP134" /LENGTH=369 /DNA_ID=CAMNT_0040348327 /DNA_START=218 /DNA_END=1327 /DNA_ORIENTATION=-
MDTAAEEATKGDIASRLARKDTKDKTIPDFPAEQGQVTVFHDLIAGGVAGSMSVVVGHPFDTMKVRMQMATGRMGLLSTITQFGGVSSLFRGLSAPLSAATAINAVVFSSYGWSSRIWDSYNLSATRMPSLGASDEAPASQSLSFEEENAAVHDPVGKAFACGAFAGLVQCFIICPTEHVKCRIQVQHGKGCGDNVYSSPLQAAKQILKDQGVKGLYRGWWVTFWREVPAFGLYFAAYDYLKDQTNALMARMATSGNNNNGALSSEDAAFPHHHHTWIASGIAGGISGALTWLIVYPLDIIKTNIQTSSFTAPKNDIKIWNVGCSIAAKHGYRYLFRGMGITLIRAFPTNAIIFPVYESTLSSISGGFA